MIGSLRGTVLERPSAGQILLEVGGVGYLCTVTAATFAELEPGVPAFLYVHHHIREDAHTLYGFTSRPEKASFEVLLSCHGIGPSMAVAILSTYAPTALVGIVATGDTAALTAVPGIGKKTAERVMVELKSRLDVGDLGGEDPGSVSSTSADVREALGALGYGPDEIREAMRQLDDAADPESMLRDALALLGVRRA